VQKDGAKAQGSDTGLICGFGQRLLISLIHAEPNVGAMQEKLSQGESECQAGRESESRNGLERRMFRRPK
jgi:hypothetical protein